jgi:hypothetical protein
MVFSVNNIRANLSGGGARPSQFQVVITNPIDGAADLKTPFMVQAAALPAFTIGKIDIPYFGRKIPIAGDRTFENWQVTIMNDEDFLVRNAMEAWNNSINRLERNIRDTGSSSDLDYKSQATVTQFGKTGEVLRVYQFEGIFPTIVAAIPLDWNTIDQIETFQVTFEYDLFTVLPGRTGDAGGR